MLVAFVKYTIGADEADNEELKIFALRFLSPVESFNIVFLPYRKNLFYNSASKLIVRIHGTFKIISALGFLIFTLFVPITAAILTWRHPNFGWITYTIVGYWWATGIFSVASSLVNVFPLPYADYSYAMKLDKLQKQDPERHKQVHAEIARTGKLPEI
jgi:hypothetical protein